MAGKKSARGSEGSERWELKDIERLIDLLIDREISEFEMEKDGLKVRILRRNAAGTLSAHPASGHANPVSAPTGEEAQPAPVHHHEKALKEPAAEETADGFHILKSPIVGTYYASPSPETPPFVKVGDIVHAGQVLCIVEAMKLINEIEAEVAGEIVRVYIESGQPVEYGQPLFAIKPTANAVKS